MSKPQGIIVFGANGSGKTTFARELARVLGCVHMDHEDYHFEKSEIPYTVERTREDCLRLMLTDIELHRSFVLSAVTGDFGEQIMRLYTLGVYISAPHALRMERIDRRAYERFGERIRAGGDMHENHMRFADFAASRSQEKIEKWAQTLCCPVVRIDGTRDWRANAENVAKHVMK